MGPDGMHMLVLSELAVAIPRPLATTTFQQSRWLGSAQRLEESKGHLHLQEAQGGGSGQLQVGQPRLHPWERDGAANPANNLQAH